MLTLSEPPAKRVVNDFLQEATRRRPSHLVAGGAGRDEEGRKLNIASSKLKWVNPFELLKTAKPFISTYQCGVVFKHKSSNIEIGHAIACPSI
jgi:hypothetical protein